MENIKDLKSKLAQLEKSADSPRIKGNKKLLDSIKKSIKNVKEEIHYVQNYKSYAKGRTEDEIKRDKDRTAEKAGKRKSENGNTYYEYRPNRTDINPKKKFEDGGNVSAINWQNFTLNELSDYIKNEYSSDIQLNTFSPLKEVKTNSGTELKQDDFISIGKISKKDKDESLSIGYAKQIEATSGSENVYLNIVVYRNDSDKPFMLSIYTKEDKKGIKELANEIIEKFEDGGNIEPTEFEVAADENVEKMAKGGSINSDVKRKNIVKFLSQFPNNAKGWDLATEEVRDLAREVKEFYNDIDLNVSNEDKKALPALDFRKLNTPSEWNTKGKKYILSTFDKMSDRAKKEFYNYRIDWFENINEEDDDYADGGNIEEDVFYGVVDANNNLVFQSKNERESKLVSNSYGGSVVKKYKGKATIKKYAKSGVVKNIDKVRANLGEEIFNHIGSLNKAELEKQLSNLRQELNRIKENKDSRYYKLKDEEWFILYRLEKSDEFEYAKGGSIATCPVGTKIQTIIFSKEFYNKVRAVKWLTKHGYKGTIGDDKSTTVRFRQVSPDKFEDDTFRTIELTKGVKAVIGCPKKKMAKGGEIKENYNYFYYKQPISKSEFLKNVPENWEKELNEYGEYSYGGYRAGLRD